MDFNEYASGFGQVAGAIGISALLKDQAARGAMYSAGMFPLSGTAGGGVFTPQGAPIGAYSMMTGFVSGDFKSSGAVPQGVRAFNLDDAGNKVLNNSFQKPNKLIAGLPIGLTALFGAQRFSEEGGVGLRNYILEDLAANYYGNEASIVRGSITNLAKVASAEGTTASALTAEGFGLGAGYQTTRTIFGSKMLGMFAPVIGAYSGAEMGGNVGETVGSGLGKMLGFGDDMGAGLAGRIFGTVAGAKIGASIATSPIRLGLGALAIGGMMSAVEVGSDILSSGFKNRRQRGLDFAGDTAAFFNQAAVTMRQKSVQAMHKSHLNARSAFGQEANIVHFNRDYFSNFRRF
tara:strand:- start:395 stop:1435 length:1041 start_codon:yes stop_codon:yes gene_type:complete